MRKTHNTSARPDLAVNTLISSVSLTFARFLLSTGEKLRHRLDDALSLTLSSIGFDVCMKSVKLFNSGAAEDVSYWGG